MTPYSILLLETAHRCIEMQALLKVFHHIYKVEKMNDNRLSQKAWESSSRLQKNYKSKVLSSGWELDIRGWFTLWNVHAFLDRPPKEIDEDIFK